MDAICTCSKILVLVSHGHHDFKKNLRPGCSDPSLFSSCKNTSHTVSFGWQRSLSSLTGSNVDGSSDSERSSRCDRAINIRDSRAQKIGTLLVSLYYHGEGSVYSLLVACSVSVFAARWLNREILEVVSTEFRDRSMEYYVSALPIALKPVQTDGASHLALCLRIRSLHNQRQSGQTRHHRQKWRSPRKHCS